MTDFAKAIEDFENACMALGDRGILEVGSDHMPKDLLKNHEMALETLMTFAAAPSEEPVAWEQMAKDGLELAEYASYAEIVGAISHNRSAIRKYCDKVFEHHKRMEKAEWDRLVAEDERARAATVQS